MWERSIWTITIIQQVFMEMEERAYGWGKKHILLQMQWILNVYLSVYQAALKACQIPFKVKQRAQSK